MIGKRLCKCKRPYCHWSGTEDQLYIGNLQKDKEPVKTELHCPNCGSNKIEYQGGV